MVEGLPVLNIFLNWRVWLACMLAVVLVLPAQQAESATRQRAAESRKSQKAAPKVSSKAVASAGKKVALKGRAAQKSAKPVKTARASSKSRQLQVARKAPSRVTGVVARVRGSRHVQQASYTRPAREFVRRVSVEASPPPAPSGRTVIASPQLANTARMSFGQLYGLHHTTDPLALKSSVAFVIDQDTDEVLVSKNSEAVLPIASLTKLMTALVVVDARQPMDDLIEITQEDVDTEKNSSSKLAVGSVLTRGEALHLALMSSENRAAHALGRYFPGGLRSFVPAMNQKSRQLGMFDSHFVDPTGLNSQNQSSAKDLVSLVKAASQKTLIRELSVSLGYALQTGARLVQFRNTNSLVHDPSWEIGLQKTGYIVEAGRCLVMQAHMAGRRLIMVFLDSSGKYSRLADAERVRRWLEGAHLERLSAPTSNLNVSKSTS
jgi:serine-type D-Ala-D-Ala endopeptidase (penicillin-binding protein 7)